MNLGYDRDHVVSFENERWIKNKQICSLHS